MEGLGRSRFLVGISCPWLAADLFKDDGTLAEFWELVALRSAMQTLSVGLIAEFRERVDDREITLTFRGPESFPSLTTVRCARVLLWDSQPSRTRI
ncbi:hypothetical protein [Methanopyrus sp. KOL6]|uniref:hypothetical protein n=1 Tax=Methanopyrus sp. KOL6 TaxID=1937004 RepID=UPI0012F87CEF|nr:hypothetical protein [Methanopyrus sp. KOL6]